MGNALGLHAIGVDISARRVKQAGLLDGEALLAYERGVVAAASQLQGQPGGLAAQGVRLSGRAARRRQEEAWPRRPLRGPPRPPAAGDDCPRAAAAAEGQVASGPEPKPPP